ncbi:Oidioi.mRNA.OKI2018_I69.PAR.g8462.t1.cds [Oikopleura dioica]|uniref:Oidioi.mRNA.OKI2018_I69.PAR.g8462.t1.cds n=1 Tax=Oikopleura dioica TaxID=34765 RepID=A0ABN7RK18_OIKDI|nr:Oidioi.mRNA.OKI2018_I69.PAR.g8462.t1.cds [Oikopleura dioica]
MKYPLTVEYTRVYSGELSTPYHMVQPGTSEKFAGETEWHSRLRGVSSQVRWQMKGYQIKFGIYSPYSQMWSSNGIRVTICAPGETGCNVGEWIRGWRPTDTRRMAK